MYVDDCVVLSDLTRLPGEGGKSWYIIIIKKWQCREGAIDILSVQRPQTHNTNTRKERRESEDRIYNWYYYYSPVMLKRSQFLLKFMEDYFKILHQFIVLEINYTDIRQSISCVQYMYTVGGHDLAWILRVLIDSTAH